MMGESFIKKYVCSADGIEFKVAHNGEYIDFTFTATTPDKAVIDGATVRFLVSVIRDMLGTQVDVGFDVPQDGYLLPEAITLSSSDGMDSIAFRSVLPELQQTSMRVGANKPNDLPYSWHLKMSSECRRRLRTLFFSLPTFAYRLGKYCVVGNTLEMQPFIDGAKNMGFETFEGCVFTKGLTSIGTSLIALQRLTPEDITGALRTNANLKLYVKLLSLQCAANLTGVSAKDFYADFPDEFLLFGDARCLDRLTMFLLPYFLKKMPDMTRELVYHVPTYLSDYVEDNTLNFYEKYHSGMVPLIPAAIKDEFLGNLASCGIQMYTDSDIEEHAKLLTILNRLSKELPSA